MENYFTDKITELIANGVGVIDPARVDIPIPPIDAMAQKVAAAKLNLKSNTEKPPYCLWINGEPTMALGDISMTIGRAKGRKTFGVGLLVAAVTGNTTIQGIRGELPDNKRSVLYIDTEQSEYYAKNSARRIIELLGFDYSLDEVPNFHAYDLRPYNPAERLQMTEYLIYNTPELGFVVIDGIRDLITSINDEEQATMISSKLLKWSTERKIHINCILHMNKGDNNARGHVGTELMNKSLTVLGINKVEGSEEFSVIEPIATRGKEFMPLVFGVDEQTTLPYVLSETEDRELGKPDKTRQKQPEDWDRGQHRMKLLEIFSSEPQKKYSELLSAVKIAYSIGGNRGKDFIEYFKKMEFLKWEKLGVTTIYQINDSV